MSTKKETTAPVVNGEVKKKSFTMDPEMRAVSRVERVLEEFDFKARCRMLNYLQERYREKDERNAAPMVVPPRGEMGQVPLTANTRGY